MDYKYAAKLLRVIDGDTYDVEIDVGFRMTVRTPLRLAHVDAPEHNTEPGKAVIEYLKGFLGELPRDITVRTYKPQDKYGRYLADVYVDGWDLAGHLISFGMAKPYEGGKKQ